MRRATTLGTLLLAATLAVSCADQNPKPTAPETDATAARATASGHRYFIAALRGASEVPPVTTDAVGSAGVMVNADGQGLTYMILVGRIDNVRMAHIHLGPPGANGPVVAWLYPPSPPPALIPGESNGVLAEGVITAANLVGPLTGQPISALIEQIRAGNTYVNVHTQQNPGGEIRGQLGRLEFTH